jgi:hypothetical protein
MAKLTRITGDRRTGGGGKGWTKLDWSLESKKQEDLVLWLIRHSRRAEQACILKTVGWV